MSKAVIRLFQQFKPDNYKLLLSIDEKTDSFAGSVTITGQKAGRPSKRLTFHQKGLSVKKALVVRHDKKGDQKFVIDRINHHRSYDEVRLHSTGMMYPGSYTISLEFSGKITKPMNGIYPCFFKHDGQNKRLFATQFESHHAREAFPCIDEPEAKATFELSLETEKNKTVLSNTPVEKVVNKNERSLTTFAPTPVMSSYLLAFSYGDLDSLEKKTKDGVMVRTFATPDNTEFTKFALDTAVKCLEFFNDYFDIPYPLKKCDLVALPDFASGAMENWGLITFREQTLLVDPANTSLATQQYVALVVAHELAHQWFGNLVTMRWWTDLWLNEGFASWIEYLAVDKLFPDWHLWTQFAVDEQQAAFRLDSLKHTHPIEVTVKHPDEIRTIFDSISYNKGASVINMLHNYLGPELFRDGLRYYLKKHAYSNTDTVDLWSALELVAAKPVKKFMHAWTSQAGFPLIEVTNEDKSITISQSRFYINPTHRHSEATLWPVPLLDGPNLPETLDKESVTVEVAEPLITKLNRHQNGFYRTVYSAGHQQKLGEQILEGKHNPEDRLGLLSDAFEAAKAGKKETSDVLHFLEYYRHEDNSAVWDIIASMLGSIRSVMNDDTIRGNMKPFMKRLTIEQYKRLGWRKQKNESHFDTLLRPTILGLAALAQIEGVEETCRQLFEDMHKSTELPPELRQSPSRNQIKNDLIDPDLRGVIYCTVARLGNEHTFEKLQFLYESTTSSEEKLNLTAALTNFKQPELIYRALQLVKSEHVRLQDVSYWLVYLLRNHYSTEAAWTWIKENWGWLEEHFSDDLSFSAMPTYIARSFSLPGQLKQYQDFFEPIRSPILNRSIDQGTEMIEWQTAWRKRDLATVRNFFDQSNIQHSSK